MWRLNFDVDVISPTPLQHHIHHILFFDDWFYAALCSNTLDSTVHSLRISTYAPLRISTYAPFMKHRKFYHDNHDNLAALSAHSPPVPAESPQGVPHTPTSFPYQFEKVREKSMAGGVLWFWHKKNGFWLRICGDWRWISGERGQIIILSW